MYYIFLGITLIVTIALIVVFSLIYRKVLKKFNDFKKEAYGKHGENEVSKMLAEFLKDGYVFDNFIFKDENGYSSEIDHILICEGGIFIIETKSNNGLIYTENEEWYAEKMYETKKITNPIKQNNGHINHLKKVIGNHNLKMYSIIIFPFADISHIESKYVFSIESARDFIVEKINTDKHSREYIERTYKQIMTVKEKYKCSKEEHIKNINDMYH